MARKVVVIGLDCAPPALLFGQYAAVMPNLAALMRDGSYGPLRSCVPPITVPAWAVMLTGRDPGELGLYGFRNRDAGYGMRTAQADDVREPWLWERLEAAGKRVAALFVPPTYPPRALARGTLVSCLLTPGADRPHTHPPELGAQLAAELGAYVPDLDGVRGADRARVRAALFAMTEQHFAIAKRVYRSQRPDFMVMVEIGPDRLHHAFWSNAGEDDGARDPLPEVGRAYYALLDAQLGELLALLDDDTTVLVVSDHGARSLRGGVCVNEWLIEHGYLVLAHAPEAPAAPAELAIDWRRTRAWAEGGYYARVCLNVEGREPQGCVPRARYADERAQLIELLQALPGPQGERVAHRVLTPEACFRAQRGRAPDVLAFFGDLAYRALGTVGHGRLHLAHDDRGADGCNHDWDGVFVMSGGGAPRLGAVEGYALPDVTRTVLGLLGMACSDDLLGVDRSRA